LITAAKNVLIDSLRRSAREVGSGVLTYGPPSAGCDVTF
jgi:hypothetical protein